MGTRILPGTVVSVQLFTDGGVPDGDPIRTPHISIFGAHRDDVTRNGGFTRDETSLDRGSEDWLTLITVAETREKLQSLVDLHRRDLDGTLFLSSASSFRVRVHVDAPRPRDPVPNAITIATGTMHEPERTLDVEAIKIFPSQGAFDSNPAFRKEFLRMIPFFTGRT